MPYLPLFSQNVSMPYPTKFTAEVPGIQKIPDKFSNLHFVHKKFIILFVFMGYPSKTTSFLINKYIFFFAYNIVSYRVTGCTILVIIIIILVIIIGKVRILFCFMSILSFLLACSRGLSLVYLFP